jgi:hypothetical protein
MKNLKNFENFVNEDHEKHMVNYMFFQNLHLIKDAIDKMLFMDSHSVDEILENGHDWAGDHIATAKESILQVADFLKVHLEKESEPEERESMYIDDTEEDD